MFTIDIKMSRIITFKMTYLNRKVDDIKKTEMSVKGMSKGEIISSKSG